MPNRDITPLIAVAMLLAALVLSYRLASVQATVPEALHIRAQELVKARVKEYLLEPLSAQEAAGGKIEFSHMRSQLVHATHMRLNFQVHWHKITESLSMHAVADLRTDPHTSTAVPLWQLHKLSLKANDWTYHDAILIGVSSKAPAMLPLNPKVQPPGQPTGR